MDFSILQLIDGLDTDLLGGLTLLGFSNRPAAGLVRAAYEWHSLVRIRNSAQPEGLIQDRDGYFSDQCQHICDTERQAALLWKDKYLPRTRMNKKGSSSSLVMQLEGGVEKVKIQSRIARFEILYVSIILEHTASGTI